MGSVLMIFYFTFIQAFSHTEMPLLSHLNIRGNPLEQNSFAELLEVLRSFPNLRSLEVYFT